MPPTSSSMPVDESSNFPPEANPQQSAPHQKKMKTKRVVHHRAQQSPPPANNEPTNEHVQSVEEPATATTEDVAADARVEDNVVAVPEENPVISPICQEPTQNEANDDADVVDNIPLSRIYNISSGTGEGSSNLVGELLDLDEIKAFIGRWVKHSNTVTIDEIPLPKGPKEIFSGFMAAEEFKAKQYKAQAKLYKYTVGELQKRMASGNMFNAKEQVGEEEPGHLEEKLKKMHEAGEKVKTYFIQLATATVKEYNEIVEELAREKAEN